MNFRAIFSATIQTIGLFIAGFVIPVLGQMVALFAPVPLILVSIRMGRRPGLIALVAASGISALLGGWQVAAVFFFGFGLMAAGISEGMRKQWNVESAVLLGGGLPVIALAAAVAYYFLYAGKNPAAVIEEYLQNSMVEAAKFYSQLGLSEMATVITSVSETFIQNLVRLIPGIMITTSVFQAACCYVAARFLILRRQEAAPTLRSTSFAGWHAPDAWVWGLIAGLVLVMVPSEAVRFIGWNLAIMYAVVYLIQGAALVEHYLRKARIQPFIRALLHMLILALPSIVFVIALGIVDIWADFRKVRVPAKTT